jgi:hypothetical protein
MKLFYTEEGNPYRYEFEFDKTEFYELVHVMCHISPHSTHSASLIIKDNQIGWKYDDERPDGFLRITPGVRRYLDKVVRLKAFW